MKLFKYILLLTVIITLGGGPAVAKILKKKLDGDEIRSIYIGKTLRSKKSAIKYKKDGTWHDTKSGKHGTYSISDSGILRLKGGYRIKLSVTKVGNKYLHLNIRSGNSGYYTLGD